MPWRGHDPGQGEGPRPVVVFLPAGLSRLHCHGSFQKGAPRPRASRASAAGSSLSLQPCRTAPSIPREAPTPSGACAWKPRPVLSPPRHGSQRPLHPRASPPGTPPGQEQPYHVCGRLGEHCGGTRDEGQKCQLRFSWAQLPGVPRVQIPRSLYGQEVLRPYFGTGSALPHLVPFWPSLAGTPLHPEAPSRTLGPS